MQYKYRASGAKNMVNGYGSDWNGGNKQIFIFLAILFLSI